MLNCKEHEQGDVDRGRQGEQPGVQGIGYAAPSQAAREPAAKPMPPPSGRRPHPARRPDDRRLSAVRARERAVAALLPSPLPGAPRRPASPAEQRLAEAVVDLDDLIVAVRARVTKLGALRRDGDLAPRAARLAQLNERRAALLDQLLGGRR